MKVYRYLGARELGEILKGDNSNIGKPFSRNFFRRSNSHRYKQGIRYLHFFQNKKDISRIKIEHRDINIDFYICEFDIPKKMMKKGVGRYDCSRGYEQFVEKAREYILPAQDFDCSWLQSYEIDKTHKCAQIVKGEFTK